MSQQLWSANIRILLWLNHTLAAHRYAYQAGLVLTDKVGDLVVLTMAAWLWFWPPGARTRPNAVNESRGRLIVFGVAAIGAYVTVRLIALQLNVNRPFATYLPVRGISEPGDPFYTFDQLRIFGSFPSDHAALLGALPVAFARWDRRLGWMWAFLALFWMVIRVALGFHYPIDIVVGCLLGALFAEVAMRLYEQRGVVYRGANVVTHAFARPRYAMVMYALMALVGIEFMSHFQHLLALLLIIRTRIA